MAENNDISLRAYIKRLMEDHERWADSKFCAMEKALGLAKGEADRKFELLNELRKEVTTDRSMFVLRELYETWKNGITKEIIDAEQRLSVVETRVSVWAAVLAFLMVIIQVVSHFLWR